MRTNEEVIQRQIISRAYYDTNDVVRSLFVCSAQGWIGVEMSGCRIISKSIAKFSEYRDADIDLTSYYIDQLCTAVYQVTAAIRCRSNNE